MEGKQTPQQIAEAYARVVGVRAEYVGAGRIAVRNLRTPNPCTRYLTTKEAARAVAKRGNE